MARRAAGLLGERYGLSGLGACDTFDQLEDSLGEAGIPGADDAAKQLRQMHACGCQRVMRALPIAVNAARLQALGGYDVAMGSIFSKIGKAVKKVAKAGLKLSPSHIIAPKLSKKLDPLSKLVAGKSKPKTQAQLDAAAAKKAQKAAAKQAKKEAKAAAKAKKAADKAAAALAAAGAQNLPPLEAGAAVLANQSGLNIQTPEGQQFAQDAVQAASGGGGSPMATDDPDAQAMTTDTGDGTIFGLPPMVAGGIALAGVGVLYLAFGGKKR